MEFKLHNKNTPPPPSTSNQAAPKLLTNASNFQVMNTKGMIQTIMKAKVAFSLPHHPLRLDA
jgi:hypothetical protein